jgi:cellulose synthase/poly-beta-1,6-N-acetylglucosamine synthase-like glycosyltransferase
MKTFFLVLARDQKHVNEKIEELKVLGVPYLIVCGQKLNHPNTVYREPMGKYDAINFGFRFVPEDTDVVILNDVDTKITNYESALRYFQSEDVALVFVRVYVKEGPQKFFYGILDGIRRRLLIAASGELMLIRYDLLKTIIPIKPCKAEDSYLLFKVLELKRKCIFSEECYVETERTKTAEKEEKYKRKTVCGIYQALSFTRTTFLIKVFYVALPFASPFLLVLGKKGYFWMKGILLGLKDFLQGDRSGVWQTTYMD